MVPPGAKAKLLRLESNRLSVTRAVARVDNLVPRISLIDESKKFEGDTPAGDTIS